MSRNAQPDFGRRPRRTVQAWMTPGALRTSTLTSLCCSRSRALKSTAARTSCRICKHRQLLAWREEEKSVAHAFSTS